MAKTKRQKLTDRFDEIIRKIVRLIYDDKCCRCAKRIYGSNSQPSHILAKGNGLSWKRVDLINIILLCNACHRWWHLNPTLSGRWFKEKWSYRDRYLRNHPKILKRTTAEWEELYEEYKQKLKGMIKGD